MTTELHPEPEVALNNDTSHGQCYRWTKWLGHLAGLPESKFLEVGSYEGQSAIWFCRNLLTGVGSRLHCVDTWAAGEDMPTVTDDSLLNTFYKNTATWEKLIQIHRGRSERMLPHFPEGFFDFAYIDGSHTATSVLSDSVLVWRLVKPGGIVIWDDYLWELFDDSLRQPKMAVDAFLACYSGRYDIIAQEWQVCVKKIS